MKNQYQNLPFAARFILTAVFMFGWQSAAHVLAQTNLPCTPPPAGMVAWYPGDGNALDIQGANDGTLQNGAAFTTTANAKVQETAQAHTF